MRSFRNQNRSKSFKNRFQVLSFFSIHFHVHFCSQKVPSTILVLGVLLIVRQGRILVSGFSCLVSTLSWPIAIFVRSKVPATILGWANLEPCWPLFRSKMGDAPGVFGDYKIYGQNGTRVRSRESLKVRETPGLSLGASKLAKAFSKTWSTVKHK